MTTKQMNNNQDRNTELQQTGRWVVKVGSSLVTDNGTALNLEAIRAWADQLAALQQQGKELLLVSSGSVAEGMRRLGWDQRPHEVHELQAAAAVGQMGLVQAYEAAFQKHDIHTAQILLTHEEIKNRQQYLNARSTMRTLVQLGVVPVINENDTIAFDEIRLGDNDNLAAMVANLVEADLLVILTDQPGLYDRNPVTHSDAKLVQQASANDPALDAMAGDTAGKLGRGGMATKIQAARRAARSGTMTVIASGREPEILQRLAAGEGIGTLLKPDQKPLAARKQWLAGQLQVKGQVVLDDGAVRVLREQGTSLLAVGVTDVSGSFTRGDLVVCVDATGTEIARGLINYNIDETRKIMGKPTNAIEAILGYIDEPELINRDDLVLL